ncbi:hypothetical protein ECN1_0917 [Escherichia coli N1]|nr:hypothetical protein ECN1_0917 [Escherichia coli N1]
MSPELLLFDITVLFNWSACKALEKTKGIYDNRIFAMTP